MASNLSFATEAGGRKTTGDPTNLSPHVVEVFLPRELIPADHLLESFRLILSATVSMERLESILISQGLLTRDTWTKSKYYRFANPTIRFLSVEGLPHNLRHGEERTVAFNADNQYQKGKLRIEEASKRETKVTLSYVTPTACRFCKNYDRAIWLKGHEPV